MNHTSYKQCLSSAVATRRTTRTPLLVLLLALTCPMVVCAGPAGAYPAPRTVVGDLSLALPAPPGLVDPHAAAPQITDMAQTMVPPANRLLALHLPEPVLHKYLNGGELKLERYAMSQTSRKADEAGSTTPDQFAQFKAGFKQQQSAAELDKLGQQAQVLVENATKEIVEKTRNKSLKMSIGNLKGMGVVQETATSITILGSMDYRSQHNGVQEGWPVVHGTTVVVIKGKPIFLYVYSPYKSQADVKWVAATSVKWKDSIERAN